MENSDYKYMLDSLDMVIYIIKEETHEILYFNDRVKEYISGIKVGMTCEDVFKNNEDNYRISLLADKDQAQFISYNNVFGQSVEIRMKRVLWQEEHCFIISIIPYEESCNYIYNKVLKADLTNDSFRIVKTNKNEAVELKGHMDTLTDWFKGIVTKDYVYEDDISRYCQFVELIHLREMIKKRKMLNCIYRRKTGDVYRWHSLEIIRDKDYDDDHQLVDIFVKDIHEIFKDKLIEEEINAQNQEIINILGELNLGIYIVNLNSGLSKVVRTTDEAHYYIRNEEFSWDDMVLSMGNDDIVLEDRDSFIKMFSIDAMRKSFQSGDNKKSLVYYGKIDDEMRYINATAYFKRKDRFNYAIIIFQDVDKQTREEMERSLTEQRLSAIIESRYSVMNIVDLDNGMCERIILGNHNLDSRKGNYEKYIHEALNKYVFMDDRPLFEKMFSLDSLRQTASEVEDFKEDIFQYRIVTDSLIWVEEHIIYMRQNGKIIVNILGCDISKEKSGVEAVKKDALLRAYIINSLSRMFFATYYVDLVKDTFTTITQIDEVGSILKNERVYSQGIELYCQNFIQVKDRKGYLEKISYENVIKNLSVDHPILSVEYRKLPDDKGNYSWIRATIVLAQTSPEGKPLKAVYVAQDITESKMKEARENRALQEACELANQANASKSEFLSRMSHDIRTPLNAIIGMTAIASTRLDDQKRIMDCLNKITISSKHLLALINEVLDMSKIESGKMDLVEEEVNISDLIQELVTVVKPSVEAKKHDLKVRIVNIDHENVISDFMRLQRVFMNLLSNAIKYTDKGGNIIFEITEKPSKVYGYGCYQFIVKDNGIGMSEEFLQKVFEPFARAEDSRVSKIEGTGLGLPITRNIIRMMNGEIDVRSKVGEGTEFEVTLFLKIQDGDIESNEMLENLPVLVVDDDEYSAKSACMILDDIGMNGEYVLNGKEAVESVTKRHKEDDDYFAVILDWQMPEMDGIETARQIRKNVGDGVPIIILSAYDWSNIEEEARKAGVNEFITKPLFKSRLVYLFNHILGKENENTDSNELNIEEFLLNKRILLVEDNELNREIAEEIVGMTGVQVESVENGKEAVERYEEASDDYYDLILMDIQMPIMNGYEATEAIRKLDKSTAKTIPIIAMTANAFVDDIQRSKQAGMNEHLSKPLDVDQLMKCLKHWLIESKRNT